MNLINEEIVHSIFGAGKVVAVQDGRITIEFEKDMVQKVFSYPGGFQQHLKMCSVSAQECVQADLKKMLDIQAIEQIGKEQHRVDELKRIVEEKQSLRKTAAKKTKEEKAAKK